MIQRVFGIASKLYRFVKPVRSAHYLSFVRSYPCVGCGTIRKKREAMHIGPHGMGQKACDLQTAPGCRDCHQQLHRIGRVRFEMLHEVDFQEIIDMLHQFYVITYGRLPGEDSARAVNRRAA